MRRCARHGLLLTALTALPMAAPRAQTIDRSHRPTSAADRPLKFPQVRTQTLPNGLRIAVVENHALPVVAVRVAMTVDSLTDPPGKEGLFALTQAMLREGTATRTIDQLGDEFAEFGDAVTGTGFTLLSASFDRALGLMADMIVNPSFPQAALERRKAARIALTKATLQAPNTPPRRMLYARLFGPDHPLTRSIVPTEAAIASITRDDVVRTHDRYFRPGNTTIVVAGDITLQKAAAAATRAFSDWKPGITAAPPAFAATPAPAPTTVFLIDRPGSTQSYVYVGQLGPSRGSADFFALETLAPILGAIPGSRLQNNLREQHAFVYASTPFTISWRRAPAPSTMFGQAAVNAAKTDSAIVEWMKELAAVRGARPITAEQLHFGQAARAGTMAARIETADSVATRLLELVRDGLPFDFYDRYVTSIRTLTTGEVSRAAASALGPDSWTIVVAGDRKSIEGGLRAASIGPVVVVDEEGKPVP